MDIEDLNREFGVHLHRRVIENDETSVTEKNCTTDNNIVEDQEMGELEYRVRSNVDWEEEKMVEVKQKKYIEAKIKMNLRTTRTISEALTEDELVDSILKEDFTIGEPDLGFDINKSVLYTHKYFKKISKARAICLICLKSSEKKRHFVKIIDSNTSGKKNLDCQLWRKFFLFFFFIGLRTHLNSHPEYLEDYTMKRGRVLEMREDGRCSL